MAISIVLDISDRIPVGNPNNIMATTDNYLLTNGIAGIWKFNISQPDDNSTMDFTFGNESFTITFKTSPDDSGYEANRPNDLTSMNTFVSYLYKNHFLAKWFHITSTWSGSAGTFTLTQKEIDGDLIFSASPSGTSNIGLDSGGSTAQVARQYRENFKMLCDIEYFYQIYSLVNPLYTRLIATLESTPGQFPGIGDWTSYFNVSDIMRAYVSYNPPAFNENTTELCENMIAHFEYKLYEMYGIPAIPYYLEKTSLNYQAFISKLPFFEHSEQDFKADYCTATYRKFLSRRPSGVWTNKDAPQYLYFYMQSGETTAKTYVKAYYDDGTSSASTLVRTFSVTPSGHYGRIIRTAVGYSQMALDTLAGSKTVHHYECWIENASARVSEYFNFTVDSRPYEQNNYLLFNSILGGFDTLWLRGEVMHGKDSYGEESIAPLLPEYTNGNFSLKNSGHQDFIVFNTGHLDSKEELSWASEISDAEEVYWVNDGYLKKVIVDQKSIKDLFNSLESVYSLEIKIKMANLE